MMITKKLLSVLLAVVLLFSVLPVTALAAETDAAAETAAEPESKTYSITTAEQLKDRLEWPDENHVTVLNVDADITGWIGTPGDSSDNSYVRYGITVAKGKKVLNLNGHKVHFYNDYSVIYDHFGCGYAETKELNRLALINIPEGASLVVNGDAEGGTTDSGMIQYHGKLLNKCDAVDQRDIFEITGGDLTVNSGYFVAGGEVKSYTWTETLKHSGIFGTDSYYDLTGWYVVHGSAIRAIEGSLTVNGGLFEGRGFDGYFYYGDERNGVLYAEEGMNSVVINNGHFYARSQANVFNAENLMYRGRFVINSGIFEVDQNDATLCTIYGNYSCASAKPGFQHIYLANPNPYTNYYYIDTNDDPWYTETPYETLVEHPGYFYNFRWQYLYIAPKQGHQVHQDLSYAPTGEVQLLYQGKEQEGVADAVYWNKKSALTLTVDPDSLYFDQQSAWDKGVTQDLSATVDIHGYNGEGDRPLLAEGEEVTVTKNSKGEYTLDLNSLSSLTKAKVLKEGKTYEFRFCIDEEWSSRLDYDIIHTASYFYITISEMIRDIYIDVVEPEYGVPYSKEIDLGDSGEFCTVEPVGSGWTYRESEEDSWTAMKEKEYFTHNKEYAFSVIGVMKEGYSLASDANIWINGVLADNVALTSTGFISIAYFDTFIEPIDDIMIFDVPEPVAGGHPINYAAIPSDAHYSIDARMRMNWYDQDGLSMTKSDTFESGKKYTVKLHVTTTDDYEFAGYADAYINGNEARLTETWTDFTGVSHARVEYTFTGREDDEPGDGCLTVTGSSNYCGNIAEKQYEIGDTVKLVFLAPEDIDITELEWYMDYDKTKLQLTGISTIAPEDMFVNPNAESYDVIGSLSKEAATCSVKKGENFITFVFTVLNMGSTDVYLNVSTINGGSSGYNVLLGDADKDGEVTILDATCVQRVLAELPVTAYDEDAADADQDDDVTILDATAIQRYLAELPTNPNIGTMVDVAR